MTLLKKVALGSLAVYAIVKAKKSLDTKSGKLGVHPQPRELDAGEADIEVGELEAGAVETGEPEVEAPVEARVEAPKQPKGKSKGRKRSGGAKRAGTRSAVR